MNQEWSFQNDKIFENLDKIPPKEEEVWSYDFRNHSFATYAMDCVLGGRRFLLKESDDTIPQARNHMKR